MATINLTKQTTIVIVEDYKIVREGLVFSLGQSEEFKILGEAGNGEEGVQRVSELNPDIVLMDLAMPVMDGIEATQRVKKLFPQIKVIIFTSHQDEQGVRAALSAGADAYCMKNITVERLNQVIGWIMEGTLWLDPQIAQTAMEFLSTPDIRARHHQPEAAEPFTTLSKREMSVLQLIAGGKDTQEMASTLNVSFHTIKVHISAILHKLSVDNRTQAAVKAFRAGMVF